MAKDPDQIVVGANGDISVAPEDTTLPTTPTGSLNAAFENLGYVSDDGVTLNRSQTVEDIRVWQSRYPARRIVTDEVFAASAALRQWNKGTVEQAFGAEVTDEGGGVFKVTPLPPDDALRVVVVVVDWRDGDKDYRLVIPRAIVSETGDINLSRNAATDLPVTWSVLAEEGGEDAWYIVTDDDSMSS